THYSFFMPEDNEIRVNFGRPMPIFPLGTVALMPHSVLGLYIFEPRYRQMISDALDGSGQIAMAILESEPPTPDFSETGVLARPAVRPAVCRGQIVAHEKLPDGCYSIKLHGVCRARIVHELAARDNVLYRAAMLEPVGFDAVESEYLTKVRERWISRLARRPLADLRDARRVVAHLKDDRLPMTAVMELVSCVLLRDSEQRFYASLHYDLLAEGDPGRRARLIDEGLSELRGLLKRAAPQRKTEAPKGCTWN
ncbi:MAG: LON peptidase substrate-binding domain-containing protein, partial [Phycisphaerales bacterium]